MNSETERPIKGKCRFRLFLTVVSIAVSAIICLALDKTSLLESLKGISGIAAGICAACFIESIFELSPWFSKISSIASPLVKFARLPQVSSVAFTLAFFSNTAANTILARNYQEGKITRREMIFSGLCNAYPSVAFDYLRIMFPVIGVLGMAGVFYFSITYLTGFLITMLVVMAARFSRGTIQVSDCIHDANKEGKKAFHLKNILANSFAHLLHFVPRVLLLVIPLYLLTAYARKSGLFEAWQKSSPLWIKEYFSPEVITIVFARFGGIFGAGAVAAELMSKGQLPAWQVVYAMLIGNILTGPIRMLRRSIPAAMGVFPGLDGLIIVGTLQTLRIALTLISIIVIIIIFT